MRDGDRDPGLPIKVGPCSNTEFDPQPMNPVVREAMRRARAMAEERARKLGIPRRRFLLSSMGAATTLAALSACSREANGGDDAGGTHAVSDDATIDPEAALSELGGDQPVIDVQTHFLEYPDQGSGGLADGVAQAVIGFRAIGHNSDCPDDEDPMECLTTERWIEEVFGRSDTTMAVISALPFGAGTDDDPLSPEIMAEGRRQLAELCDAQGDRVLVQGHGQPNGDGDLEEFFEDMEAEAEAYDIVAWKSYTHFGEGWMLDDSLVGDDAPEGFAGSAEPIGSRYLGRVMELYEAGKGPNIIAVHKGLSIVGGAQGSPYASPADIGPAAVNFPELQFCVYHSGYEVGEAEGPYDRGAPNQGADRLISTLQDNDIGPNSNVYAELGGTWRNLMALADDDEKAHLLGKLLLHVGEDRVLWGTDSIWFGSPQDQIESLRTFEISEQFQEQYGYPALTDEIKQKIFWKNAAGLHGVDTYRLRCQAAVDLYDSEGNEEARQSTRLGNWTYGPRNAKVSRRVFLANHPWAAL